jgi:hypothetical protein
VIPRPRWVELRGTRTPDPHTASSPFEGFRTFAKVRKACCIRRFSIRLDVREQLGMTANLANGYRDGYQMILLTGLLVQGYFDAPIAVIRPAEPAVSLLDS